VQEKLDALLSENPSCHPSFDKLGMVSLSNHVPKGGDYKFLSWERGIKEDFMTMLSNFWVFQIASQENRGY